MRNYIIFLRIDTNLLDRHLHSGYFLWSQHPKYLFLKKIPTFSFIMCVLRIKKLFFFLCVCVRSNTHAYLYFCFAKLIQASWIFDDHCVLYEHMCRENLKLVYSFLALPSKRKFQPPPHFFFSILNYMILRSPLHKGKILGKL